MKNLIYIILTIFIFSCEKEPNTIVYGPSGNLSDQKVLIEEFTGVNCTNCPAASDELSSLNLLNQGNLSVISIHAGFFSNKTIKNKYDFRTTDGDQLLKILGAGNSYPAAVINRTNFSGSSLVNDQASWAGEIQQLRSRPAKAGLSIETFYDKSKRELHIKLTAIAKENINEKLLANVFITESNIIDWQKDGRVEAPVKGENANYVHNHVFRDAISQVAGDDFVTNPSQGQTFTKEYTYTLSDAFVAENCEIVGFITSSINGNVLQVNEAKVVH